MPKKRCVHLILNPLSGQATTWVAWLTHALGWRRMKRLNATAATIHHIKTLFNDHHIDMDYSLTQGPKDATVLAQRAVVSGNYDTVIAMGGDGTINEVVNGLVGSTVMLGVIPYGTANVFGISFNLPTTLKDACLVIIRGNRQKIDVGAINNHYFVCMAGVGFDAYVIKKADQSLKKTWGALSYVIMALWAYVRYRFHPIIIKVDHDPVPKKGYFLMINNTPYYGGRWMVAPNATPTDGRLDISLITKRGLWPLLRCGVRLWRGHLTPTDDAQFLQCQRIDIRAFGHHRLHADAEYVGHTPAKIRIHPKALCVIT